jgi:hypothetical protein
MRLTHRPGRTLGMTCRTAGGLEMPPDKQAPAPTLRAGVSFAGSTRSFSLCGGEFEHHIVAVCLVTRTFEPRQSRLYGVGGSSAFGNICADAIVKSSTSLRNSVSLNSRMLAYAATTRSARTRALRSCVILTSAIVHRLPCDQPSVPGTEFQKSTKHYSRWVRSANDTRFS